MDVKWKFMEIKPDLDKPEYALMQGHLRHCKAKTLIGLTPKLVFENVGGGRSEIAKYCTVSLF